MKRVAYQATQQQSVSGEFIEDINMEENTPVIHNLNKSTTNEDTNTIQSKTINPLSIDILTNNGEVNTNDLHELQEHLLQPTPLKYFTIHHRQHFHVDTGANVHATTKKSDFLIYYPHKKSINIAAGHMAQSEGFGVVMVLIVPNQPPLPLALVYYCPNATTGTLSPQCLLLYNKCRVSNE